MLCDVTNFANVVLLSTVVIALSPWGRVGGALETLKERFSRQRAEPRSGRGPAMPDGTAIQARTLSEETCNTHKNKDDNRSDHNDKHYLSHR